MTSTMSMNNCPPVKGKAQAQIKAGYFSDGRIKVHFGETVKPVKNLTIGLLCMLLGACGGDKSPPEMPPATVGIVVVEATPTPYILEYPGRVQAVRTAEVRARVNGIVDSRLYEEGLDVTEGQTLFQIDPRELLASLNAVKASEARAKATAANAAKDVARFKSLVADQAISEQEYDTAVARLRAAEADVAQFQAQRESAELSLSFATVSAPIAGRAGRAQVTEGALVSSSAATLLTTIEQLDPIYVNFSRSSVDVLRTRREVAQGTLEIPEFQRIRVDLVLEDGTQYDHAGHLDFFNFAVDQATGTVAVRAEFPNPEQLLFPGQFVQAQIQAGVRPDSIQIPQRGVQLTAQGATVLVVGEDNVVATRNVTLGELYKDSWRIVAGLKIADRVIVDGVQKIKNGQTVNPQPFELANQTEENPDTGATEDQDNAGSN